MSEEGVNASPWKRPVDVLFDGDGEDEDEEGDEEGDVSQSEAEGGVNG